MILRCIPLRLLLLLNSLLGFAEIKSLAAVTIYRSCLSFETLFDQQTALFLSCGVIADSAFNKLCARVRFAPNPFLVLQSLALELELGQHITIFRDTEAK